MRSYSIGLITDVLPKYTVLVLLSVLLFGFSEKYTTVSLKIKYKDGTVKEDKRKLVVMNDFLRLQIPVSELRKGIDAIEVHTEFGKAKAGDDGYSVHPTGMLCNFREQADNKYTTITQPMPIFGVKTPHGAWLSIVKGLRFECSMVTEVKAHEYHMYHTVDLKDVESYEDLIIDYYELKNEDANYSGMGRLYRKYQLDNQTVIPIRERVKKNPFLDYAAQAPEIRIRQGWKPVPTPIAEQTLETEPEMKVVVTFDRVSDIIDELKRQGVEKAEICLVGWNIRGHDGRWPTAFPVEPKLGGEKKLRALIEKAQKNGYQIVCHSNSGDAYRISPDWDEKDMAKHPNGDLQRNAQWSGGQMYNLCYKASYDKFVRDSHKRMADLGFRGLHYIDVLSIVRPTVCYDKAHPVNRKLAAEYANKHLVDAATKMGGVASEGGFDHTASSLDYALYVTFSLVKSSHHKMVDAYVPIWHIVYNGIILSNPASATINYTIKEPEVALKMMEYAARPSFYFYSGFRDDGRNWMGNSDLRCGNAEELTASVTEIKKGYDDMLKLGYLQYEYLENHEEIVPNVFKSTFSDGSEIVCNYSSTTYQYQATNIEVNGYKLFKQGRMD